MPTFYFAKGSGALAAHILLEKLDIKYSPIAVYIPDIRPVTLMFSRCVAGGTSLADFPNMQAYTERMFKRPAAIRAPSEHGLD